MITNNDFSAVVDQRNAAFVEISKLREALGNVLQHPSAEWCRKAQALLDAPTLSNLPSKTTLQGSDNVTTTNRILAALQKANSVRSFENNEWEEADLIDGNPEEGTNALILLFPSGDNTVCLADLEEATISEDELSFSIGDTKFFPSKSMPVKI